MTTKDIFVILDPGHGVDVAGKCSPDKSLREYKWAREIRDMLQKEFKAIGVETYDTVEGSEYEPGLGVRTTRANAAAKKHSKQKSIFLSIHSNAAPPCDGQWHKARGWCAFTTKGKTNSDRLAECMYNYADKEFKGLTIRRDKSDGDSDWEANFYVIKHTTMPAVLVENFFQDNKEDVAFLLSAEGKQKCVDVMKNGILSYFGIETS